jgi:hypothetical protein
MVVTEVLVLSMQILLVMELLLAVEVVVQKAVTQALVALVVFNLLTGN